MSDEQLFFHHIGEAEKAFNRLKKKYKEFEKRADDRWITTKTEAAEYLGIGRTTFYKNYINRGLVWKDKGVKKSQLDSFQPKY